jgi:hypothetical protein
MAEDNDPATPLTAHAKQCSYWLPREGSSPHLPFPCPPAISCRANSSLISVTVRHQPACSGLREREARGRPLRWRLARPGREVASVRTHPKMPRRMVAQLINTSRRARVPVPKNTPPQQALSTQSATADDEEHLPFHPEDLVSFIYIHCSSLLAGPRATLPPLLRTRDLSTPRSLSAATNHSRVGPDLISRRTGPQLSLAACHSGVLG